VTTSTNEKMARNLLILAGSVSFLRITINANTNERIMNVSAVSDNGIGTISSLGF
jgi:hypothetical protein